MRCDWGCLHMELPAVEHEGYELFKEVFQKNMAEETFIRKHFANPDLLAIPVTTAYNGDRLVSMQWYLGAQMMCMGKQVLAAQAADTCSSTDARGFPYIKVWRDGNKVLKAQGCAFRFQTPNQNSFPVVTKLGDAALGNYLLARMDRNQLEEKSPTRSIFKRTRKHVLTKASKKIGRDGAVLSRSKTCPFDDSDFSRINSREDRIFPLRTPAYMEWKIDGFAREYPRDFTYITIRNSRDEGLMAYCILQAVNANYQEIVDWFIYPSDQNTQYQLMSMLTLACFETGDIVVIPFVNPDNEERCLFESIGYKMSEIDNFSVQVYDDECADALVMSNWALRRMDLDYFLNVYI